MARAITPVLGVALLTVCVVALGVTVGTMVLAHDPPEPAQQVLVSAEVDAGTDEITLTLDRGGPLDVRDLSIVVEIDGEALDTQPTAGGSGLVGFPSGPLNPGTDPEWTRGESISFTIAETTNGPHPEPGSEVTVRLFSDDLPIATVEATAS